MYKVIAETENAQQIIGRRDTKEAAIKLANRHLFSLDPDEDECPEMSIHWSENGQLRAEVV